MLHQVECRSRSLHELNTLIRPDMSKDRLLANVLAGAFHDEPNFFYVLPEERARRDVLPAFFLGAIRVARLFGQVDTTPHFDGCALWTGPGGESTFSQMIREGTLMVPFDLEWSSLRRGMNCARGVSEVRHRLIDKPHWYLMALGVAPSRQGGSIGSLLEAGLTRADSDGLPCYLETFQEGNLPFYEEHGFRIAGAGCIPGGPSFWAMIRVPRHRALG